LQSPALIRSKRWGWMSYQGLQPLYTEYNIGNYLKFPTFERD
jgi:hypothetical protein